MKKLKEYIPVLSADKDRVICKDPNLPYNFIIEGDNLHALYLLEKTHRNKIDCIYIDPPYNSGAHDWKYNNDYVDDTDAYKHSKWLSMMKDRLQIAKKLLNPE
jgi:adenine-specific DNA-methyltransferase